MVFFHCIRNILSIQYIVTTLGSLNSEFFNRAVFIFRTCNAVVFSHYLFNLRSVFSYLQLLNGVEGYLSVLPGRLGTESHSTTGAALSSALWERRQPWELEGYHGNVPSHFTGIFLGPKRRNFTRFYFLLSLILNFVKLEVMYLCKRVYRVIAQPHTLFLPVPSSMDRSVVIR